MELLVYLRCCYCRCCCWYWCCCFRMLCFFPGRGVLATHNIHCHTSVHRLLYGVDGLGLFFSVIVQVMHFPLFLPHDPSAQPSAFRYCLNIWFSQMTGIKKWGGTPANMILWKIQARRTTASVQAAAIIWGSLFALMLRRYRANVSCINLCRLL